MIDTDSLAAMGFHVFDIHGVQNGVCTCGRAGCAPGGKFEKQAGKHPVSEGAFAAQKHSLAHTGNIGIATGAPSGVFVIDVDPGNGGVEGWAALCAANGGEPPTLSASTGGGGRHLYYELPELPEGVDIRNSAGKLAPGVDVRGSGGYVLAPGSAHRTGGVYKWIDPPACQFIERAPQWLIDLVTAPKVVQKPVQSDEFPPADAEELAAAEMNLDDWLAKSPPQAGQGNGAGYTAACFLVRNWALSVEEAQPLFERYTQRTISPRSPEESLQLLKNAALYGAEDGEDRRLFRSARKTRQDREAAKKGAGGPSAAPDLKGYVKAAASREQAPADAAAAPRTPPTPRTMEDLRARMMVPPDALLKKILCDSPLTAEGHGGDRPAGGAKGAWQRACYAIADRITGEEWPLEMLWQLVQGSWQAEPDKVEASRTPKAFIEGALKHACETSAARAAARELRLDQWKRETAAEMLKEDGDTGEWLAPFIGPKGLSSLNYVAVLADALRHSPRWKDLRFDSFRKQLVQQGTDLDADDLVSNIRDWASRRSLPSSEGDIRSALRLICQERSFDSYEDRFDALPVWDGTPRLLNVAKDYLHATGETADLKYYAEQCVRAWLVAMVARCYAPACKVDNVLILAGSQGDFKSALFETLAGDPKYYVDTTLEDPELTRALKGVSVLELGEFDEMSSLHDINKAKRWCARGTDRDRPLYAQAFKDFPRRFVVGATSNDASNLRDETGNRRFWIVPVGSVDCDKLKVDMPQILAEARAAFFGTTTKEQVREYFKTARRGMPEGGGRWWFDKHRPEDARFLKIHEGVADSYMADDAGDTEVDVLIERALYSIEPGKRPSSIDSTWVFDNVITSPDLSGKDRMNRLDRNHKRQVGAALRRIFAGVFHKPRGKTRSYTLTEAMQNAPRVAWGAPVPTTRLQVVRTKGEDE